MEYRRRCGEPSQGADQEQSRAVVYVKRRIWGRSCLSIGPGRRRAASRRSCGSSCVKENHHTASTDGKDNSSSRVRQCRADCDCDSAEWTSGCRITSSRPKLYPRVKVDSLRISKLMNGSRWCILSTRRALKSLSTVVSQVFSGKDETSDDMFHEWHPA